MGIQDFRLGLDVPKSRVAELFNLGYSTGTQRAIAEAENKRAGHEAIAKGLQDIGEGFTRVALAKKAKKDEDRAQRLQELEIAKSLDSLVEEEDIRAYLEGKGDINLKDIFAKKQERMYEEAKKLNRLQTEGEVERIKTLGPVKREQAVEDVKAEAKVKAGFDEDALFKRTNRIDDFLRDNYPNMNPQRSRNLAAILAAGADSRDPLVSNIVEREFISDLIKDYPEDVQKKMKEDYARAQYEKGLRNATGKTPSSPVDDSLDVIKTMLSNIDPEDMPGFVESYNAIKEAGDDPVKQREALKAFAAKKFKTITSTREDRLGSAEVRRAQGQVIQEHYQKMRLLLSTEQFKANLNSDEINQLQETMAMYSRLLEMRNNSANIGIDEDPEFIQLSETFKKLFNGLSPKLVDKLSELSSFVDEQSGAASGIQSGLNALPKLPEGGLTGKVSPGVGEAGQPPLAPGVGPVVAAAPPAAPLAPLGGATAGVPAPGATVTPPGPSAAPSAPQGPLTGSQPVPGNVQAPAAPQATSAQDPKTILRSRIANSVTSTSTFSAKDAAQGLETLEVASDYSSPQAAITLVDNTIRKKVKDYKDLGLVYPVEAAAAERDNAALMVNTYLTTRDFGYSKYDGLVQTYIQVFANPMITSKDMGVQAVVQPELAKENASATNMAHIKNIEDKIANVVQSDFIKYRMELDSASFDNPAWDIAHESLYRAVNTDKLALAFAERYNTLASLQGLPLVDLSRINDRLIFHLTYPDYKN